MSKRTVGALAAIGLLAITAAITVTVFMSTRDPATSDDPGLTRPTGPVAEEGTPSVETDDVAVALSLVLDEKGGYENRVDAIRRLGRKLGAGQVASLQGLLRNRNTPPTIRNDVLVALAGQELNRPTDLGTDLIAMWKDTSEDAVWRDYCLQHMAGVYDTSDNRAEIEATLLEVARGGGRVSGTAMLSLERLGKRHPQLAEQAKAIARNAVLAEERDDEAAVTAIQIARAAGDSDILAEVRSIAADTGAMVRLRMSAVGTLGELGEEEDVALLTKLCQDEEGRVRRTAKHNLARLRQKLGDQGRQTGKSPSGADLAP